MSFVRRLFMAALFCALSALSAPLFAQRSGPSPVLATPPAAAQGVNGHLDPEAATRAYLATLPSDKKAKSDAYFEGGYWLILWDFVITAAIYLVLLGTGLSARMRNSAERITRSALLQSVYYAVLFIVVTTLVSLPWTIYEGYVREHTYGLSNLTFGAWLGEQAKGFGVSLIIGALLIAVMYAIVRKLPRTWWVWGALTGVAFAFVGVVIAPVVLTPIFNSPTKLADARVVDPILRLARQNGIEATDVWEIDASKQSKRISANVSGAMGTERITLNDNLLNRASLEEIEAVMGHEMGHYVLNHVYKGTMEIGILIVIGFALVAWLFERLRARFEASWQVRGIADPAGLPLVALLFAAYFFVTNPIVNTLTRTAEYEADVFGLNTARQPDGFAQIAIKLSEYRKLDPGPWEEKIFFDHPSGRTRIYTAMRWKAENLEPANGVASGATT
ncbi:MAG: M48 family metallopeptidase, partial [Gemmatimonadota bacterium]|nr:M48 family metallopeptidase [Gemmatimonadota bacterium]